MVKAGLEIRADMKLLRKEMADATAEFRSFNKAALNAASGVKPLEDQARKAGGALGFLKSNFAQLTGALGLTNIAGRAVNFFREWGKAIISATSNLTELTSKAQVVFGESFPKIQNASRIVAADVGRASSAILQFATDIGAVISAFGITGPLLDDMSVRIAQLAVDMASFHNTSDDQAFMALRSGLTGETEPLKRFGIVLTDTNLKLFALEKGIKTKVEAMNQAQKTALRYEFIMEKTALAQGDAARTADSFANQSRRLEGELRSLNEEAGKLATPILADAIGGLAKGFQTVRLFVRALTSDIGSLIQMIGMIPGMDSVSKSGGAIASAVKSAPGVQQYLQVQQGWGALFGMAGNRIKADHQAETSGELGAKLDALSGFNALGSGVGAAGGGGADAMKKLAEEREKAEKEVLAALTEEAKVQLEKITAEREELMLRKEMGILTRDEERRLNAINRRLEFKNEKIEEATKAWKEQADEVKKVEKNITDLIDKIEEEKESLEGTLNNINKEHIESQIDLATKLIEEKQEMDDKIARREGLSEKDQSRLKEIDEMLSKVDPYLIEQGTRISGLDDFEKLEEERQNRQFEATEKSNFRQAELNADLAAERSKLEQVKAAEAEKKQVVIDSLNERLATTQANYKLTLDSTREHVTAMIAEFNRLAAAQSASASPRYAAGGPVSGPGGPTDDRIAAWLSNGEYVINAAATRAYRPILDRINSLSFSMPRFARGGAVSSSDSHDQHIAVTQHLHGDAARSAPDPRLIRWTLRKYA